ncbi:MAG TPA: hypothetical protein VK631_13455 [Solirubrobacteraceae bacterium]|nr:hypothetical protein [Solirubrobacteraceae bacterium]
MLWDPHAPCRIEAAELHDGWPHSPFARIELGGRIRSVYLRGAPIVVEDEFVGRPRGRYVSSGCPRSLRISPSASTR